jgi:hypothetical protein
VTCNGIIQLQHVELQVVGLSAGAAAVLTIIV